MTSQDGNAANVALVCPSCGSRVQTIHDNHCWECTRPASYDDPDSREVVWWAELNASTR